jgi:hypothetical protein
LVSRRVARIVKMDSSIFGHDHSEINAKGFRREGDSYVNEAYGDSEVTLNVEVQGGVGEINLKVV